MVAQQINQKNDIIIELQQKIKMLQHKYKIQQNGILQDQVITLRKQIQKLHFIINKLQRNLQQKSQNIQNLNDKLQKNEKILVVKQKELMKISQEKFQIEQNYTKILQMKDIIQINSEKIQKILQKLKFQQKRFSKLMKGNHNSIYFTQINLKIKEVENSYKLFNIFNYLQTFKKSSQFVYNHIFDSKELSILQTFQQKIKKYINSNNANNKDKTTEIDLNRSFSIIQNNIQSISNHLIDDKINKKSNQIIYISQKNAKFEFETSFLQLFKTSPQKRQKSQQNTNQSIQLIKTSSTISPSMKLIQLQIQKSNLIQKIFNLKAQSMYTRNIVLNLLKSLELTQISKNINLKPEVIGILELVMEIFQFSYEEKQLIFKENQIKIQELIKPTQRTKIFGFI